MAKAMLTLRRLCCPALLLLLLLEKGHIAAYMGITCLPLRGPRTLGQGLTTPASDVQYRSSRASVLQQPGLESSPSYW